MKCPKCGAEWTGDCFTTGVETPGKFKPKCNNCGFVFEDV